MTPNFALVHVQTNGWRGCRLWLPLFLLWIPALLVAPFILLVLVVACLAQQVNPWRAIATLWALLCSLPGTDVRVVTSGARVMVRIL